MIKSGYLPTTDSKLGNGTLNKFFVARVIEFNVLKVCAVFIGSKKNIHRFDSLIWITFGFGRFGNQNGKLKRRQLLKVR